MITISQGVAYNDGKPVILHVIDVETTDDYKLLATFSDGVTKIYNMKPLLEYEAFKVLKDINEFNKVTLDHGIPTWEDANVDISP